MADKKLAVKPDPQSKGTVVLSRWPTEKEKTKAYHDEVRRARRGQ